MAVSDGPFQEKLVDPITLPTLRVSSSLLSSTAEVHPVRQQQAPCFVFILLVQDTRAASVEFSKGANASMIAHAQQTHHTKLFKGGEG